MGKKKSDLTSKNDRIPLITELDKHINDYAIMNKDVSSYCGICLSEENELVTCSDCHRSAHPKCIDLPETLITQIKKYAWTCADCKVCDACHDPKDDHKLILCDGCDRGMHIYCVKPILSRLPRGSWYCEACGESTKGIEKGNENYQNKHLSKSKKIMANIPTERIHFVRHIGSPPKKKWKQTVLSFNSNSEDFSTQPAKNKPKTRKVCSQEEYQEEESDISDQKSENIDVDFSETLENIDSDESAMEMDSNKSPNTKKAKISRQMRMLENVQQKEREGDPRLEPSLADRERFRRAQDKMLTVRKEKMRVLPANDVIPKIEKIEFGLYEIDTWFIAPYPEEYNRQQKLYICEYCLKYMSSYNMFDHHMSKCEWRHPPGDEIYRNNHISIFEVDGKKNRFYCQNLCLLAKMFLDHKTLYYDVEPFLFYVMTECDEFGCHFVGYFSKEKRSLSSYNVSCIVTLPIHQRKGYGHLLIDFSYLLSKKEGIPGTPEKPLSDFGTLSYRSYWKRILLDKFAERRSSISIKQLSQETCITTDDIIYTLHWMEFLHKDQDDYFIYINEQVLEEHIRQNKNSSFPKIDPSCLRWIPFESKLTHEDSGCNQRSLPEEILDIELNEAVIPESLESNQHQTEIPFENKNTKLLGNVNQQMENSHEEKNNLGLDPNRDLVNGANGCISSHKSKRCILFDSDNENYGNLNINSHGILIEEEE